MKRALIVMAKRPFPGQTKTRLTPFLSPVAAAELYSCFLQDTLDLVRSVSGVTPFIAFAPETAVAYFQQLAPDFNLVPQQGDTLGERLDSVLTHCLEAGYDQVAAINSDGPTLPAVYLSRAFDALDIADVDVVLGGCEDGGYYLIGWKERLAPLVRDVPMSTATVFDDTVALAAEMGVNTAILPTWYDVDAIADLARVAADIQRQPHVAAHTQGFLENHSLDFSGTGFKQTSS